MRRGRRNSNANTQSVRPSVEGEFCLAVSQLPPKSGFGSMMYSRITIDNTVFGIGIFWLICLRYSCLVVKHSDFGFMSLWHSFLERRVGNFFWPS